MSEDKSVKSTKPAKPRHWRAFDSVERKIGAPLEGATGSARFVDVALRGMKVQRAVGGAVSGVAGGAVNKVLRIANLPTRGDIKDLSRQVTVLTNEVRALKSAQAEAERPVRRTPRRAVKPVDEQGADDSA